MTVDDTSRPPISGRLMSPAAVGDLPSEIWKYWDRNTVPANIAIPTKKLARVVSDTVRLRKIPSGMIGSAALRSTRTAATRSTSPTVTSAAVCQDAQSKLLPARDVQISSAQTPVTMRKAPSQSILTWRRTVGSFRVRWSSTIPASANGTPMKKHQRQPSHEVSTRTPPISGPATVPTAKTAPKMPAYLPSLLRRDDGGHHDLGQCRQATGADALDDTADDQGDDVLGEAYHQGTDHEQAERELEQQLLVEQVGELAPQRHGGRHGEQLGGHDPGVRGLARPEVGDDPRQGVGDDRAREDGDEHARHQAGHRLEYLTVGHGGGRLFRRLGCGHGVLLRYGIDRVGGGAGGRERRWAGSPGRPWKALRQLGEGVLEGIRQYGLARVLAPVLDGDPQGGLGDGGEEPGKDLRLRTARQVLVRWCRASR